MNRQEIARVRRIANGGSVTIQTVEGHLAVATALAADFESHGIKTHVAVITPANKLDLLTFNIVRTATLENPPEILPPALNRSKVRSHLRARGLLKPAGGPAAIAAADAKRARKAAKLARDTNT